MDNNVQESPMSSLVNEALENPTTPKIEIIAKPIKIAPKAYKPKPIKSAKEVQVKPIQKLSESSTEESYKLTGSFKSDIGVDKSIYKKNDTLDSMEAKTREFVANTSKRVFATADKEEQRHVEELVANTYYPTDPREEVSEEDLVKRRLNLI